MQTTAQSLHYDLGQRTQSAESATGLGASGSTSPSHPHDEAVVFDTSEPVGLEERHTRPRRSDSDIRTRCPVCDKSFSRPDHMYRHFSVHQVADESSQNTCSSCGKSFSRRDALQRHQQTHGHLPSVPLPSIARKLPTKTRKACERCSRMKIKCDGLRPCQRCKSNADLRRQCEDEVTSSTSRLSALLQSTHESMPSTFGDDAEGSQPRSILRNKETLGPRAKAIHSLEDGELGPSKHRRRLNEGIVSAQDITSSPAAEIYADSLSQSPSKGISPSSRLHDPQPQFEPRTVPSSSHQNHGAMTHGDALFSIESLLPQSLLDPELRMANSPPNHASNSSAASVHRPAASTVTFSTEVERISIDGLTPASDQVGAPLTPTHVFLPEQFSQQSLPNDVVPMSDLEWLFATPEAFPTTNTQMSPFSIGIPEFDAWMAHSVSEPSSINNQPWDNPPSNDNLLELLAGAASLSSQNSPKRASSSPRLDVSHTMETQPAHYDIMRHREAASPFVVTSNPLPNAAQSLARKRLEPRDLTAPSRRGSVVRELQSPPPRATGNSSGRKSATVSKGQPDEVDSGEETAAQQAWPNSWYPARGTSRPRLPKGIISALNANATIIAEESTCQVPPIDQVTVHKLHALADFIAQSHHDEEAPARQILRSINVETYNLMLQLYFEKFHPRNPFLHQATFNPGTVHPLLLAACCGVGCAYSSMSNATLLSEYLMNQVHHAIQISCNDENLHARSLGMIQALLLIGIFFGTSGNKRLLEYAEYQRTALGTMVRRCHFLEHSQSSSVQDLSVASRQEVSEAWKSWIHQEAMKRTGWACVLADLEFSGVWKVPPIYTLEDLKAELPCPERTWEAPNAEMWRRCRPEKPTTLPEVHDHWQKTKNWAGNGDGPSLPFAARSAVSLSLFTARILGSSFLLYAFSLRSISHRAFIGEAAQAPALALQDLLDRISASTERSSDISSAYSQSRSEPRPSMTALALATDFVQLFLAIDLTDLQRLGGRKGGAQAIKALNNIHQLRLDNPQLAESVLKCAGRILHLIRDHEVVNLYSANVFFYASLYVFAFSKSLQITMASSLDENPSTADSDRGGTPVCLDAPTGSRASSGKTQEVISTSERGALRYQIRFVGDITAPSAPIRILKCHSTFLLEDLSQRTPGRAAEMFGRVLAQLVISEERAQRIATLQGPHSTQSGMRRASDTNFDTSNRRMHPHSSK